MDTTRNPIRETILQLYASGLSKREIRKEIGCSAHTISKYLAGPVNELGSRIIELRSKGLSVNDIRSALRSKSTVSKWCSTIAENDILRHTHSQKQKQITMELGRGTNCNYRNWRKSIREKRKNFLIEIAGGGCAVCDYNITKSALDFHHVDPITKKFGICGTSLEISINKLLKEVSKCILLCYSHFAMTTLTLALFIKPPISVSSVGHIGRIIMTAYTRRQFMKELRVWVLTSMSTQ